MLCVSHVLLPLSAWCHQGPNPDVMTCRNWLFVALHFAHLFLYFPDAVRCGLQLFGSLSARKHVFGGKCAVP